MPDTVLLVVDDEAARRTLGDTLERAGFEVYRETGAEGGRLAVARLQPAVVLADVSVLDRAGSALLGELRGAGAAVVALAGARDLEAAIRVVRRGAESFVAKGGEPDHVVAATTRAAEKARLARELAWLRNHGPGPDLTLLGASPPMRNLAEQVARAAATERAPVLLAGDTGSGKALIARIIHRLSARAAGPFIAVPRGTPPVAAVIGQERGVQGDGRHRRVGLLELADGGTFFVPDVAALPNEVQQRLVTVLDSGRLRRLGGTRDVSLDVRIVAATERDLVEEMRAGRVSEDLLYRLSVTPLVIPAVRERPREDRLALVERLVTELAAAVPGSPARCSPLVLERLADAAWPGNVREMRHVIERALLAARGAAEIDLGHLPGELRARGAAGDRRAFQPTALAEAERLHIERALRHFGGNRTRTAQALGISRATLINKIRGYGLTG